jgi:hypothetical protein
MKCRAIDAGLDHTSAVSWPADHAAARSVRPTDDAIAT